ncbi:MAG: FtsX-like permease family protein [Treponemataceae bacterium]|nr:FtsX-like permease family protein [Treponemataceae bacterium]
MKISSIAARTLIHDKRRYIMLFFAASIGMALTFSVCGMMNGMMNSLYNKARIYYGGDAMLLNHYVAFGDYENFQAKLEPYFKKYGFFVSPRIDYSDESYVIFEGTSIKQRKLKGVDFTKEEKLFKSLNFVSGDALSMKNSNGILISQQLADLLTVQIGDNLTLLVKTTQNYTNTASVIVKGIFQDTSVFGQNISYLDIDFLRNIVGISQDTVSTIGIFSKTYNSKGLSKLQIAKIHKDLSGFLNMYKLTNSKNEFLGDPNAFRSPKDASKICLVSLDANLDDIAFLIDAMHLIIFLIMAVLIIIIAIGIGSTYKIIAVKRINEIGIYMALGMKPSKILFVFLIEAFFLLSLSFGFSLFLSLAIMLAFRMIDFSGIPNFDIFLSNSHILINLSWWQILVIFAVICIVTMFFVFMTIRKNVKINPVDALSVAE